MRPRSLTLTCLLVAALAACSSPAADADNATEDGSGTELRSVAHAMGTTEVPADPQRVVTLDTPHLDTALSLGVTPVGSVQADTGAGLPGYLGERVAGIELVGTIDEPDLEAIAALEPDLILSSSVRHEEIYDRLGEIAPTVFTDYEKGWQSIFTTTAEALDLVEEGEEALAGYEERAQQVGEQVGAGSVTASMVRFLPEETRIYGPETFSGSVLTDIGFTLPDLDYDEYSMVYISPEQIQLADTDVIFSTTYGDPAETTKAGVTALWGNLAAVPDCHLEVADDEWMLGIGLIGADVILSEVEEFLSSASCS